MINSTMEIKSLAKLSLLVLIFFACEDKESTVPISSWNTIQEQILTPSCANCHIGGTAIAKQSGLDLSKGNAYSQMVNVPPKNISAKNDGLVIVSNEGGMKGLGKSYLWEKINAYDREHFLSDHPEYGQMMPPSGNFLTNGQLQVIRGWIEGGAPETGIVVDEKLLQDSNRYEPPEYQPLDPPENGFQLHLGPFEIQPNFEREFFYYTDLNLTEDVFVNRIQIEMRPGSHHFILYSFLEGTKRTDLPNLGEIRELRYSDGAPNLYTLKTMQFHQFFGGTQWPRLDYRLPPGVALRIPSQFGLDQNAHFVNRTDTLMVGEVYSNIHTIDKSKVQHIAELFGWSNMDFSLPPNKITIITKTFDVNNKIYIGQVFSHAHEKMTEFVVKISGGPRNNEVIYWTDDWQHPPIINYDPAIELNPGEGLTLIAPYDNPTDQKVKFGFLSTNEMMIVFGGYYQ